MRAIHAIGAALLALAGAFLTPAGADAQSAGFVVVVHETNGVSELPAAEVARYFLKRATRWPSGEAATPVDATEGSSAREAFSRDVLRKTVSAVKAYWQTLIFSGQSVPPAELSSDEAILSFVRANPGAIGYVSARTTLGPGVRRLTVIQ